MSNIIRLSQPLSEEMKIIQTRKIETQKPVFTDPKIDPRQQQQQLLQEINELEAKREQLQAQLVNDQQNAQREIDEWWQEKQQESQQHAQRVEQQAKQQGFQAGFTEGLEQVEQDSVEKRAEMTRLLETAYEEKATIIQQAEPFLLSLSVTIAEKVIHNELIQDRQQLLSIIQHALKQVEEAEDVTMQVSPEDYSVIIPFLEELKTYIKADSELKLVPVANLTSGGCRIHTASGSYDAMIDHQLEEIKNQLLAYCEEKTNDELVGR
ncbi:MULTISPECIES: FliH/SctL family protein [Planococcus]|uniref:Flagellar assembly protein FliH n=1 Tax=Planococcus faecalis TaxID=1598147 RepID=A0ABM6IR19_9BACL|nr:MULTISPECIES: FliH/SctL family protein [Planococcus]AQU77991.1 flagellar assembly protein FliH [Planococcus faecalis]MDJ0331391.1 FliH/SctL family protein [Planococcus sp. S3-L1]OHX52194.1 flagellar assembly protein FliH [Planococcus faecalis]